MNERVFYGEPETDLAELQQHLKSGKAETILLVLPRRSVAFESVVNLQILRDTARQHKKKLVIICSSPLGRELCVSSRIPVFASLEAYEKRSADPGIPAQKNVPIETHRLQRVPISLDSSPEKKAERSEKKDPTSRLTWREILARPSWQALLVLVLFSGGLFFFLTFLAFPGATVEIEPERKGLETITNVDFVDSTRNKTPIELARPGVVSALPLESDFTQTLEFTTQTKLFRGKNAEGEITLFNTFPEERRLKPTTRFQSSGGLVFRITDWVTVPPGGRDAQGKIQPGQAKATVVADEKDTQGEFVGARGNVAPDKFFLPALPAESRQSLWAESTVAFHGGVTDWIPQVAETDIEAAKKKITADLTASAATQLQNFLKAQNAREKKDLVFFPNDKFLEKEISDLTVEDGILGTARASFHVSAHLKVRTWAYSKAELYTLLWDELSAKADPKMHLMAINIDPTSAELVEKNAAAGVWKVALHAEGAEEFLIDPRSEAGIRFVNDVKEQIVGRSIDEAEALLTNREEVSAAHISVWPFWKKALPTLPENIAIRLLEKSSTP